MAHHSRGMPYGFNTNQGYPMIDWSNVPAPSIPPPWPPQQVRWTANYQYQPRPTNLESPEHPHNPMLQNCNEFFNSWRAMGPPQQFNAPYGGEEQYSNFQRDQNQFNYGRPMTPPMPIPVTEIFSPNTVQQVRTSIRELFPYGPPPPPPYIPVDRRRNRDSPYMVGCSDRQRIPERRSRGAMGGDTNVTFSRNYGFPSSRLYLRREELSPSFRANEHMDMMQHQAPDNYAVPYMSTYPSLRPQSFSPLPSTSRDQATIMQNERYFTESLRSDDLNANNDDDDESLPEVKWGQSNVNTDQNNETGGIEEPINEEPSVENDLHNNNNNNEVDLTEVQNECPVTQTTSINDPIIINDDDDVEAVNEAEEPTRQNNEIIEDYEDAVSNDSEPYDINNLFREIYKFHQRRKVCHHKTFTLVYPSNPEQNAGPMNLCVNANITVNPIANRESTAEVRSAPVEAPEVIVIPDPVEPSVRLNQQQPSNDVVFVSEVTQVNSSSDSSDSSDTDDDESDEYIRQFLSNVLTNNGNPSPQKQPQTPNTERPVNKENAESSMETPEDSPKKLGDCPICMENLADQAIASTTCGHVFCLSCIKKCLRTNGKKCPTCRKALKGLGYHKVFF